LITTNRLVKNYKGVRLVFEPMTFNRGLTLVKGNNGSGKTTLLKALGGLVSVEGSYDIEGRAVYLPEKRTLPYWITPHAYLSTLAEIEEPQVTVERWLQAFNLHEKRLCSLGTLSNGMQQKVHLISVLMLDRAIYLLDEPFNALDRDSIKELLRFLKKRNRVIVCACHQVFDDMKGIRMITL